jgi:WhiB family transcriptional regulator, redox-sensing transcriptional regulator
MTVMLERAPERRARVAQPSAADWRELAACRREDPELFYEYVSSIARSRAKAVCLSCPVLAECYAAVMDEERGYGDSEESNKRYRYGVRAALTSAERWAIEFPGAAERERVRKARKKASVQAAA